MSRHVLAIELINLLAKQARKGTKEETDRILKDLEQVLEKEVARQDRLLDLGAIAETFRKN